jgi:hypothetical protein
MRPLLPFLLILTSAAGVSPAGAAGSTHPCGPTWGLVTIADPDPGGVALRAVDARSSSDVWAAGSTFGGARAEHWDGAAWTAVPMEVSPGTLSTSVEGLAALAKGNVWAVGQRVTSRHPGAGRAFTEHWNGAAWSSVPTPDVAGRIARLYAVDGSVSGDAWAVGYVRSADQLRESRPLILRAYDGVWQIVPSPRPRGRNAWLSGVHVLAADDAWAVGSRQPPLGTGAGDRTLIEHWDGTRWSIVPSPEVDDQVHLLTSIDGNAPNDLWAAGSITGSRPLVEHWDGRAWSIVDTGLDRAARYPGVLDLAVVSAHDVWVLLGLPESKSTFAHFDGSTWSPAPGPPGHKQVPIALDASPRGDLWAVGHRWNADTSSSPLVERICPSHPATSGFGPADVTTTYDTAVAWAIPSGDTGGYRLSDATGLGLFDSGPLVAGDSFTFTFTAAGTYPVSETTLGTSQTVRVRPTAVLRPRWGAGMVKLTWAGDIPIDLVADVQVKRPGSTAFEWVIQGTHEYSSPFEAGADPGRYVFRARLRNPVTGATSGWSPPAHVSIVT